jgi:NAD(P)H-dependent FMN reductase
VGVPVAKPIHLLAIAGSSRTGSYTTKLVKVAADIARAQGAEVTFVDLRALELPLYDQDYEVAKGVPAGALKLRDLFAKADGLIVATAEYNGFPTPLMINAFDWLSRAQESGDLPSGCGSTSGKPCGIVSCSPGGFGGRGAANAIRPFFAGMFNMLVVPEQFALGSCFTSFDDAGALLKEEDKAGLTNVVSSVVKVTKALKKAL